MLKKLLGLKWWIIAGLLCAIVISFTAYQKDRAAEKYREHRATYCSAFMSTEEQKVACEEEKAGPDDYLQWGYKLIEWPEGVTTWALILTLGAFIWQATLMRKHADHFDKLATATSKSVQVMLDSERPWIVAHMEQSKGSCLLENGNVRFKWTVKNVGKSPAKLIDAGARATLDTLGPPLYPVQYKMETLDDRILVPGDSAPFFVFWSNGRLGRTLEEFNDLVIIFGLIRYHSATNPEDVYETRFAEASTISKGVCDHFEIHFPVNPEDIRCT